MYYFSLPCDFKNETIDGFQRLNEKYNHCRIIETYGQITTGNLTGSGRRYDLLPKADIEKLRNYIEYSKSKSIGFNYTFNASCFANGEFTRKGLLEIKDFINKLIDGGVRSFTVSIPSIIELINYLDLNVEIKASAISNIISPDRALFYKKLGVNRIVPNTDVNRDFNTLDKLVKVFPNIELIVNSICYKNCPYKIFHYNHESHSSNPEQVIHNYYFHRCTIQKANELKDILRCNWIRPEDLDLYLRTGIKYFKIQGRNNVHHGDPVKAIEAYMTGKHEGNLYDLLTLFAPINAYHPFINNQKLDGYVSKFFTNRSFCKDICDECGYCQVFASKSLIVEQATELNKNIIETYLVIDDYRKSVEALKSVQNEVKTRANYNEVDSDFIF